MGNGPRDYSDKTIKRLFALSGNLCAFPGCTRRLVNGKNAKDSNICHIEAANIGGERYNENMTDDERADYDNLILLCVQHHDETNDVNKYTVSVLKQMKKNHESQFLNEVIARKPSMLRNTINAIASIDLKNYVETPINGIFDPCDKIRHNLLKKYAIIIEEYKVYHTRLNTLYDELENQGSIKKEKLLQNIKLIYDEVKGEFIQDTIEDSLKIIQNNSDNIFDKVYDRLYNKLEASNMFDEDVFLGIRIIMVDAFMRCKILEEPL
jgi:hypothetical protein